MNILRDQIVITRKPHKCDGCTRMFPSGTKMKTQINTYEGKINTFRTCPTCTELIENHTETFFDEVEQVFWNGCVKEVAEGRTPEQLLDEFNNETK